MSPAVWTWHEALWAREAAASGRCLPPSLYRELARRQDAPGAAGLSVLSLTGTALKRENPHNLVEALSGPAISTYVPAEVAIATEAWRARERRRGQCRKRGIGCLLYGINGAVEARSWAPCACRDCSDCAPWQTVQTSIQDIDAKGLLTLTQKPDGKTWDAIEHAWLRISDHWEAFRHWLARNHLDIGRYLGVLEAHVSLMPHLHIVTEHFPDELAVDRERELKTGAVVQVRRVERSLFLAPLRAPRKGEAARMRVRAEATGIEPPERLLRADSTLHRERLKDAWAHITDGAHRVEWERLMAPGSGRYIAKYLTKLGQLPER